MAGMQEDPDEIIQKLDDLLEGLPSDQYAELQASWKQLFIGVTYEIQVRRTETVVRVPAAGTEGEGEDDDDDDLQCESEEVSLGHTLSTELALQLGHTPSAEHTMAVPTSQSRNPFLKLTCERSHRSLTQTLDDFTSWQQSRGDGVWTRQQLQTVPPFLCFDAALASELEWEPTLELESFLQVSTTCHVPRPHRSRSQARADVLCFRAAEPEPRCGQGTLRHSESQKGKSAGADGGVQPEHRLRSTAVSRRVQQVRERSSAEELCGPHVAISLAMLRSSNWERLSTTAPTARTCRQCQRRCPCSLSGSMPAKLSWRSCKADCSL